MPLRSKSGLIGFPVSYLAIAVLIKGEITVVSNIQVSEDKLFINDMLLSLLARLISGNKSLIKGKNITAAES